MEKGTAQIHYTVINHVAREKLGLSWIEYGLADLIYHLSSNNSGDYPGWCYASKETLAKNIGVTKREIFRMLNLLEEKKIIERHSVTKHIKTTSYWYNKVIIKEGDKMSQPVPKSHTRGDKMSLDGSDKMSHNNKDIYDKERDKEIILHSEPTNGSQVNELLELFEPINPSYRKFFSNLTQRRAVESLVNRWGYEKVRRMLEQLPEVVARPYAPMITTPCQLESKLGELILFVKKEQGKGGGVLDGTSL